MQLSIQTSQCSIVAEDVDENVRSMNPVAAFHSERKGIRLGAMSVSVDPSSTWVGLALALSTMEIVFGMWIGKNLKMAATEKTIEGNAIEIA